MEVPSFRFYLYAAAMRKGSRLNLSNLIIFVIRLLLIRQVWEGIYNHGESIVLDLMWLWRKHVRKAYIYTWHGEPPSTEPFGILEVFWVEIMPKYNMIRYCVHQGYTTYRYLEFKDATFSENETVFLRIKGWRQGEEGANIIEARIGKEVHRAREKMFYDDVDRAIS